MATSGDPAPSKDVLRAALLAARRERSPSALAADRSALASVVLDRVADAGWRRVAAYEPLRTEPGSAELLTGLSATGVTVIVPVTLPDGVLDWRPWPAGGPLGLFAIGAVDAVLVPALAVARDGTRLGRGRGYYDRALALAPSVPRVALVFDEEVLERVPGDPWDVPMDAAATPSGWVELPGGGRLRGNADVPHLR